MDALELQGAESLISRRNVQPNKEAMRIAKKYRMSVMYKTIRMYSQKEPEIKLENVYGVTSFELG